MKLLKLTQGLYTKVSDEDFEYLSQWTWRAARIAGTASTGKIHLYGHKAGRREKAEDSPTGKSRWVWVHNEVMKPSPGLEVDHINGDPLDNRKENLRVVTHKQNCANRGKTRKGVSSSHIGVSWHQGKSRWRAIFNKTFLGWFKDEIAAARAYNDAAYGANGDLARLNDIPLVQASKVS